MVGHGHGAGSEVHHGLSAIICTVEAGGIGRCACQGYLPGAPISGASEDR